MLFYYCCGYCALCGVTCTPPLRHSTTMIRLWYEYDTSMMRVLTSEAAAWCCWRQTSAIWRPACWTSGWTWPTSCSDSAIQISRHARPRWLCAARSNTSPDHHPLQSKHQAKEGKESPKESRERRCHAPSLQRYHAPSESWEERMVPQWPRSLCHARHSTLPSHDLSQKQALNKH